MVRAAITGLVLMLASPAYGVTNQFDLDCKGSFFDGNLSNPFSMKRVFDDSRHYRIDLSAKRWCSGSCETTNEIMEYGTRLLVLEKSENSGAEFFTYMNRESGEYVVRSRFHAIDKATLAMGKCEPMPFSGFPTLKF